MFSFVLTIDTQLHTYCLKHNLTFLYSYTIVPRETIIKLVTFYSFIKISTLLSFCTLKSFIMRNLKINIF